MFSQTQDHLQNPEFISRSGLQIIHMNVKSLLPKVDLIKLWITSTDADILVLSETWLNKSVLDKDIYISRYNIFCWDRPKRGGGIAIYVKNRFHVTLLSSLSVFKQFELLTLSVELSKGKPLTGCFSKLQGIILVSSTCSLHLRRSFAS